MKAIRYHEFGPPEVLRYEDVPTPQPGPDEVLIRVAAVGVNASEVSRRGGHSPLPPGLSLPMIPGYECSGTVEAVGARVTSIRVGERVIGRALPHTYMEHVAAPAARVHRVPGGCDLTGAATVVSGLTMAYQALVHCARVQAGEWVLVHAVGSGTGIALVQMAKRMGATVIGTASTDDKLAWARGYGLDHGVNYVTQDFVGEVKRLTDGRGVAVVVEGLGGTYLVRSLACLSAYGRLVNYGRAGGPRSVELLLPDLWANNVAVMGASSGTPTYQEVDGLLQTWAKGEFKATVDRTWPLRDAAEAHRYIEARRVRGRVALTVP